MPTQPTRRGPGRPRKDPETEPTRDTPDTGGKAKFPPDERIGQTVADPRWTDIGFDDGRGYRVENGRIVERVR